MQLKRTINFPETLLTDKKVMAFKTFEKKNSVCSRQFEYLIEVYEKFKCLINV